jgi:pimeloyl-ACP methyl ester carboxylesterase
VNTSVRSADGTTIGYSVEGEGPLVILVGGAMQWRGLDPTTIELATALAARGFTVINYDRRGRGVSDRVPTDADREVEDIAALLAAHGGSGALYGSSSGAAISLWAAQAGLPVTKLVLWEIPLSLEEDTGDYLGRLRALVDAGEHERAVETFMEDMPPQWLDESKRSPAWPLMVGVAASLVGDADALDRIGGRDLAELFRDVTQPVLVLVGSETLPIMPPAARAVVAALPNATLQEIDAADHRWTPEVMVPVLAGFYSS